MFRVAIVGVLACAGSGAFAADDWLNDMPTVEEVARVAVQEVIRTDKPQEPTANLMATTLILLRHAMERRAAVDPAMTPERRDRMDRIDAQYQVAELAIGARVGMRSGAMTVEQAHAYYESRRYEPCATEVCYQYEMKEHLRWWGAASLRQLVLPLLMPCDTARVMLDLIQQRILEAPTPHMPALNQTLSESAKKWVTRAPATATCGSRGLDIDGDGMCFDWEARLREFQRIDNSCQPAMCEEPTEEVALENRSCQICVKNAFEADPAKESKACSADPQKVCFTCVAGTCANHCDNDPKKETMELKRGDIGDLDAVTEKLKKIGGRLPPPIEIIEAEVDLSVYGTAERGEKCCDVCSVGTPAKSPYTKLAGGYKFDLSLKWGLKGFTGGHAEMIPLLDNRILVSWKVGPFVTINGSLGSELSREDSDCAEGACTTVGVSGALGAKLEAGGAVKVGADVFDRLDEKCKNLNPEDEAGKFGSVKDATGCFKHFSGVNGELQATGGVGVAMAVTDSNCPSGNKCEVALDKVGGKIFYRANLELPFFTHTAEGTLWDGTLYEGGSASCL